MNTTFCARSTLWDVVLAIPSRAIQRVSHDVPGTGARWFIVIADCELSIKCGRFCFKVWLLVDKSPVLATTVSPLVPIELTSGILLRYELICARERQGKQPINRPVPLVKLPCGSARAFEEAWPVLRARCVFRVDDMQHCEETLRRVHDCSIWCWQVTISITVFCASNRPLPDFCKRTFQRQFRNNLISFSTEVCQVRSAVWWPAAWDLCMQDVVVVIHIGTWTHELESVMIVQFVQGYACFFVPIKTHNVQLKFDDPHVLSVYHRATLRASLPCCAPVQARV